MLTNKEQGEFTAEDEALVRQLAAIASLGLQHIEARGEAERRATELEAVFGALPDLVFIMSADGTFLDYHKGAATPIYLPPERFLGRRLQEIMPAAVARLGEEGIRRALEERTLVTFEYPLRVAGLDEEYEARILPLDTDRVLVIARNITHRRRAEVERERLLEAERRAREEAEAALRLRDQFLSVAAHELRTPLTSLRGQAELTMQRIEQGRIRDVQQVRGALQIIDRQVDRLSTLVAQLLDISRIEAGELELERGMVDLVPLAQAMVETMQAGATRHALSLQAPEALQAFVDPLRLEQVLYNLLDNAIRYSPRGGPVQVELSTPAPGTVRIAVRDYGIGVPPEQRERLFTRFFQVAQRPAGGLGLGLYISRRIVELHGGRIWAEFPEDGGSRFVVELPRSVAGTEATKGTVATPLPNSV